MDAVIEQDLAEIKTSYVVGETVTPSILSRDLLVLGSGSGQTSILW